MFGVRFSFVATRSGLTRVRHYDPDDMTIKKEALAFARKHARAIDETFYSRTVDFNMLVNDSATLIQVPFNTHQRIQERLSRYEMDQALNYDSSSLALDFQQTSGTEPESTPVQPQSGSIDTTLDESSSSTSSTRLSIKDMNLMEKLEILTNSSLHVIATQSIIVNEGTQRAVAGVTGVFYDYASFVMRLLNTTNYQFPGAPMKKPAPCFKENPTDESCDTSRSVKCGLSNDTIDCLFVDNNGYIIVSEDLEFIGRHLKAYDATIMNRLVSAGVFHEINITDYQSICVKQEEKQTTSSAGSLLFGPEKFVPFISSLTSNFVISLAYSWTIISAVGSLLIDFTLAQPSTTLTKQQQALQPMLSLIPNKTYLRPCERVLTRYETRPGAFSSDAPEYYTTRCDCQAWFIYEQVPKTNLIMLIVDTTPACRYGCDLASQLKPESIDDSLNTQYNIIGTSEDKVCSMLEREFKLYRKKLDHCYSHHPEEEQIKLCGAACESAPICNLLIILMILFSSRFFSFVQDNN